MQSRESEWPSWDNHKSTSSLPKVRSSAGIGQTKKYPPNQAQPSRLEDFANAPCQQQSPAMHMITIDTSNLCLWCYALKHSKCYSYMISLRDWDVNNEPPPQSDGMPCRRHGRGILGQRVVGLGSRLWEWETWHRSKTLSIGIVGSRWIVPDCDPEVLS
jgi:hypothetical protein